MSSLIFTPGSYINIYQLKRRCQQTVSELLEEEPGFTTHVRKGKYPRSNFIREMRYAFKDNGSNILAVAHCDVAHSIRGVFQQFSYKTDKDDGLPYIAVSPALDDRLGVHIILDVLPRIGINVDILLTDLEESGNSTASLFQPPEGKEYNWIFSFDRSGDDVVMYDYDTEDNRRLLRKWGLVPGWGTFSDIAYLTHLGVVGFNFGCGYHQEHSQSCHAFIGETERQIYLFERFFLANQDRYLEHIPEVAGRYWNRGYASRWDDYRSYGAHGGYYDTLDNGDGAIQDGYFISDDSFQDDRGRLWIKVDGTWILGTEADEIEPWEEEPFHKFVGDELCDSCHCSFDIHDLAYSHILEAILCRDCAKYNDRHWESLMSLTEKLRVDSRFRDAWSQTAIQWGDNTEKWDDGEEEWLKTDAI